MKIGFKLSAIMITLCILSVVATGTSLLLRSYFSITGLSHDKAVSLSKEYSGEISSLFTAYWYTTDTTALFMEQFHTMRAEVRRPMFNTILHGLIEENTGIVAAWCVFEPDVLEGNDSDYAETEGSNARGNFVPQWTFPLFGRGRSSIR